MSGVYIDSPAAKAVALGWVESVDAFLEMDDSQKLAVLRDLAAIEGSHEPEAPVEEQWHRIEGDPDA